MMWTGLWIASKLVNKEHIYPVFTLLFTLPGIPSIYYGSEWGIEGRKEGPNDDFLRPAVEIGSISQQVQQEKLTQWVRALARIHTSRPELAYGVYRELFLTNRQYAFARILGESCVLVAVNNDEQEVVVRIPLPMGGGSCRDLVSEEEIACGDGQLELRLEPCGSRIFLYETVGGI